MVLTGQNSHVVKFAAPSAMPRPKMIPASARLRASADFTADHIVEPQARLLTLERRAAGTSTRLSSTSRRPHRRLRAGSPAAPLAASHLNTAALLHRGRLSIP